MNRTLSEALAVYEGLEPSQLWRHFAKLNTIPRPPGHEAEARSYVQQVAEKVGARHRTDRRGNLVVYIPAVGAGPQAPSVAVQSHLDMVCEKRDGLQHDFLSDPIRPRREGLWIYGSGTTLGADNGIGVAACLALMTDTAVHGPLELLFTVEEETGLHGALDLDGSLVESRVLINLDSEDPTGVTVGCAGGASVFCRLPAPKENPPDGWAGRELRITGLKGGHSGVQIHERLANAIKLLTAALAFIRRSGIEFRVASLEGGKAHNAIARDALATLVLHPASVPHFELAVEEVLDALRSEWGEAEPGLSVTRGDIGVPQGVISKEQCNLLLALLEKVPHGVVDLSPYFANTVQTSANLARTQTEEASVEVLVSVRSLVQEKLEDLASDIRRTVVSFGGTGAIRDVYPGWEPNPNSRLLELAKREYPEVYGRAPEVQVLHAGLECGVIVSKLPGTDAISFGPLIRGAHSPDEGVLATTVEPTWMLLKRLLGALAT